MRHLMISFAMLALSGFVFGCGSSDEGTTVVIEPTAGDEYKPAPAPVFQESEFDGEELEIEAGDEEYEYEIDD